MSHRSLNADILKIRHGNVTAVYRRCIDSVFSFLSTSCQIGLGASVNHELQVSLQIFRWLLVRALGGPLEDIQGFVPKPAHDPGCVSVVLLEGGSLRDSVVFFLPGPAYPWLYLSDGATMVL